MYQSCNYTRSFNATLVSREVEGPIRTDDIVVRPPAATDAPPAAAVMTLTTVLEEMPVLWRVRACADVPLAEAVLRDPPSGGLLVDGTTVHAGDSLLLTAQTPPLRNGVAVLGGGEVQARTGLAYVETGDRYRGGLFVCDATAAPVPAGGAGGGGGAGAGGDVTLASETAATGGGNDALSLVGPSSRPPALSVRFLRAGAGIRLAAVESGRGVEVGCRRGAYLGCSDVRSADVVETDQQMVVDVDFDLARTGWPLAPFTVPALVYRSTDAATTRHEGSANFLVHGVPWVEGEGLAFALVLSLALPAAAAAPVPLAFAARLTLATAAFDGELAVTLPRGRTAAATVTWNPATTPTVACVDGVARPALPAGGAPSDVYNLRLSMAAAALPEPVAILGLCFRWYERA